MLNLILTIIQVICGLAVIAVVMLQSGKSAGLSGAIAGGADTFLSKNKAKSVDAKLAKMTKWVAIVWIVLTPVSYTHLGGGQGGLDARVARADHGNVKLSGVVGGHILGPLSPNSVAIVSRFARCGKGRGVV